MNTPTERNKKTPTAGDLLGALDHINKSTTWGGRNARELDDLVMLKEADWKRARGTFDAWVKDRRRFSTWKIYVGLGLSAILLLTVPGAWKWLFGPLTILFVYGLGHRDGINSGWFSGYEMGYRDVVFRSHKVNEEDAEKMKDKSIQMTVEESAAEATKRHK